MHDSFDSGLLGSSNTAGEPPLRTDVAESLLPADAGSCSSRADRHKKVKSPEEGIPSGPQGDRRLSDAEGLEMAKRITRERMASINAKLLKEGVLPESRSDRRLSDSEVGRSVDLPVVESFDAKDESQKHFDSIRSDVCQIWMRLGEKKNELKEALHLILKNPAEWCLRQGNHAAIMTLLNSVSLPDEVLSHTSAPQLTHSFRSFFEIKVFVLRSLHDFIEHGLADPEHCTASDLEVLQKNLVLVAARFEEDGLTDRDGVMDFLVKTLASPNASSCEILVPDSRDVLLCEAFPPFSAQEIESDPTLVDLQNLTKPMRLASANKSAKAISKTLLHEHSWMKPVIYQIERSLLEKERWQSKGALLPPLLLVGPPGSGKTHFLNRLASLMGVPHQMLAIGGMTDNMLIKGNARNWNSARPSEFVSFMAQRRCPNPVFILDEIDKISTERGRNGNPQDTLLQLLDPSNAARFFDEYIGAPVNLSHASFVATANDIKSISAPMRDRMQVIMVPNPGKDDLVGLAQGMYREIWRGRDVPDYAIPLLPDELLDGVIHEGMSIRQVKRVVLATVRHLEESGPISVIH